MSIILAVLLTLFTAYADQETGEPVQAFWGTPAITAAQRAPLAILYLVDTLRADHTGAYGYKRNTTDVEEAVES